MGLKQKFQRVEKEGKGKTKEKDGTWCHAHPFHSCVAQTQFERFHPSLDYFCPKLHMAKTIKGSKSKDIEKQERKDRVLHVTCVTFYLFLYLPKVQP